MDFLHGLALGALAVGFGIGIYRSTPIFPVLGIAAALVLNYAPALWAEVQAGFPTLSSYYDAAPLEFVIKSGLLALLVGLTLTVLWNLHQYHRDLQRAINKLQRTQHHG